jgi:hypothetical protein
MGYDRIQGALAKIGHDNSDQTIGNILKQHSIALMLRTRLLESSRDRLLATNRELHDIVSVSGTSDAAASDFWSVLKERLNSRPANRKRMW